jgi:hypothetical protein
MVRCFFIFLCFGAILFFFDSCNITNNDENNFKELDIKLEKLVLSEENINIEYFTKLKLKNEILEYKMTYLGIIDNLNYGKLRFIFSTVYSGNYEDSKKANSIITIYNENKRLGYYYVGGGFNKTPIILNNELIFQYDDENCDRITKLNFSNKIPKQIFIECKKKNDEIFGDLYSFVENVNKN